MQTLEEYEAGRAAARDMNTADAPKGIGDECPDCDAELTDDGLSLVSKVPPMKRVTCPACGFSKVVLA